MQSRIPNLLTTPLLAACLLLGACGGGGGSSASSAEVSATPPASQPSPTADTKSPEVASRAPVDQATQVSINALIVVEFDENLDQSSVDEQSLALTLQAVPVAGATSYDSTNRRLTFTPEAPLAADTVYGVSISSSLEDMAGNLFLGDNWFFTTGGPFNLGLTSQSTIDECMDDGDKVMLTLVNTARATPRDCGGDAFDAQAPLAWDCMLDQSSLNHSRSMADNDFHDHISPVDGTDPGDRIRAAGYIPQTWGENIAAGYANEDDVVAAWLTSPGHCSNIMSAAFTQMGAAAADNAGSTFGRYWTQNFGRPQD